MDPEDDSADDAARRPDGPAARLPEPEPVDRRRVAARQQEDAEFQALIHRVADGDEEALGALYDQAGARIYGLLLRILRSPDQATAITQEVFVDVWQQARRYHPSQGSVFTWIVTFAHQRGIDRVRTANEVAPAQPPASGTLSREIDDVWAAIGDRFGSARVRAGLEALSHVQRQALLLAYFEGFSQTKVAAHLSIPLASVRLQMFEGLVNLRRALGVADD